MKKLVLLVVVIILLGSTAFGCAAKNELGSLDDEGQESVPTPTHETLVIINDWADIPTFEYMVNKTENIVIARVAEKLPAVSMTRKELGVSESTRERIFTSFNLEVIESLKGIFGPGDIVRLEQDGGTVGNKTLIIRDSPLLKQGSTYLFFIYEPKSRNEGEYFNYVVPEVLDGRVEIINGIIIPHKWSRFYKEGMSIEEIKEWIEQEKAEAIFDEYSFNEDVPNLFIMYDNQTIMAAKGTYSWMIEYGIYGMSVEADSGPPEELVGYQERPITIEEYTELRLVFSRIPTSYTVRIWNEQDYDLSQEMDVYGDTISIAKDQPRTIYTVTAKFEFIDGDFKESGTVHYVFVVNREK